MAGLFNWGNRKDSVGDMDYNLPQECGEKRARKGQKHREQSEARRQDKWFKHGPEKVREIEWEIERLSQAEREWKRVGVHSSATSTAVHCSAQPPLCSLLTIRFHALKRPLQEQSCAAQRAACWWTATLQRPYCPPLCSPKIGRYTGFLTEEWWKCGEQEQLTCDCQCIVM